MRNYFDMRHSSGPRKRETERTRRCERDGEQGACVNCVWAGWGDTGYMHYTAYYIYIYPDRRGDACVFPTKLEMQKWMLNVNWNEFPLPGPAEESRRSTGKKRKRQSRGYIDSPRAEFVFHSKKLFTIYVNILSSYYVVFKTFLEESVMVHLLFLNR